MFHCARPRRRIDDLVRIFSGFLAAGLVLPMAAQTSTSSPAPTPPYSATFAMVGFTPGETVRLNVLNIQDAILLTPAAPCVVQAAFLDAGGRVIKSTTLTVNPGASLPFDLGVPDLTTPIGLRAEVRAVFTVPVPVPTPQPSSTASAPGACAVFPSVEVFNNVTGETRVYTTHHKLLPVIFAVTH
jgi:hypothetical protein